MPEYQELELYLITTDLGFQKPTIVKALNIFHSMLKIILYFTLYKLHVRV